MYLSLTPSTEKAIADRIASGLYSNANEVLESALAVLAAAEAEVLDRIRRRNMEAYEQYKRGDAMLAEDFMAELRAEYGISPKDQ